MWKKKSLNAKKMFIIARKYSLLLLTILKQNQTTLPKEPKSNKKNELSSPASGNVMDLNNHGVLRAHRFETRNKLGISKTNDLSKTPYY